MIALVIGGVFALVGSAILALIFVRLDRLDRRERRDPPSRDRSP
jgi:hypothetical protein